MSPYRLIIKTEEITTSVTSKPENPFPLEPQQLANLIGLRSRQNLYPREKELGLTPERKPGNYGSRLYNDPEVLALAKSFGCRIESLGHDQVIIGRTLNVAFIRNKP